MSERQCQTRNMRLTGKMEVRISHHISLNLSLLFQVSSNQIISSAWFAVLGMQIRELFMVLWKQNFLSRFTAIVQNVTNVYFVSDMM